MWEYIVYWSLVFQVSVACPDSVPDEYGRTSMITCPSYHTKSDTIHFKKEFVKKSEATQFIKNGLKEYQWSFNNEKIIGFELDSIKVN